MNNTIQPVCGNFLFLRGPYVQCRQQVDLWEHTSNLCADITEKSNSAGSRGPFQRSQNAKLYLRTKATWVRSTQATNLKSCHCICSFVFIPLPAHTSLFSLTVAPPPPHSVNTANSGGACGHIFQAQQKLAVRLNKRLIKNSLSLSKMFYSTRIMQMGRFGK